MVTPLDIGLLQQFDVIFVFLFVLVMVYAILSLVPFFKEHKAAVAMIAFLLAIMSLYSTIVIETIKLMSPWFVLLFIFIVFFILAYMIFGATEEDVINYIKGPGTGKTWVMALVVIIGLGSLSAVISREQGGFGTEDGEGVVNATEKALVEGAEGQERSFWEVLFHPKVLGMAVLLLIAFFTISKLTAKPE